MTVKLALAVTMLMAPLTQAAPGARKDMPDYKKPPLEELKKKLTPLQFEVTQREGTERPFDNPYWDNKRAGLYVDVVSGEPLFSSADKFDSGTGWPSFTRPLVPGNITEKVDKGFFTTRTEVRSKHGDSHLGHVFPDAPEPAGLSDCMNSASLRFIAAEDLEKEGYGEFKGAFAKASGRKETAVLAGGCFWGMEDIIRKLPGVLAVEVGYTGGKADNATYDKVKAGGTGHAEAVLVEFDPALMSYEQLLGYFFRMHDPTTLNRQGNDIGDSYRSAVFYRSDEQRAAAEKVKKAVDASGKWKKPVVTQVVPFQKWWKAEEYHQDYLQKNPGGYTCHWLRD
ncbi:MAG: bifunctional methionine sulfoxide reductase B/A protein [Elusimicrobia bacterium]|nr:bifunctional methionine sulfoxide reductase B/A protein [Elusimicrobiota bacterium]